MYILHLLMLIDSFRELWMVIFQISCLVFLRVKFKQLWTKHDFFLPNCHLRKVVELMCLSCFRLFIFALLNLIRDDGDYPYSVA